MLGGRTGRLSGQHGDSSGLRGVILRLAGAWPVINVNDDLVGEQTSAEAYASRNLTPRFAKPSILGILNTGFPWQRRYFNPRSSALSRGCQTAAGGDGFDGLALGVEAHVGEEVWGVGGRGCG